MSVRLAMLVVVFGVWVVVPVVPAVVSWAAVVVLAAVVEGDAPDGRVISTETQFGLVVASSAAGVAHVVLLLVLFTSITSSVTS